MAAPIDRCGRLFSHKLFPRVRLTRCDIRPAGASHGHADELERLAGAGIYGLASRYGTVTPTGTIRIAALAADASLIAAAFDRVQRIVFRFRISGSEKTPS
ncbi:hypothetical protein [Herbaspirillum rubrisubalbicans]|uniref:hypothetical protein n=1 Tax=Herbaspirillum rubrisubalbicans TaxID=80842 RepID=UPI0011D1EA51|nr:hypothetical protein [Herbaspirillum rubrisubalbicans]